VSDEPINAESFLVTLNGGGGPEPFHRALARKFAELVRRGSFCVVVGPLDRPTRYVQAIVNPAGVRVESVGSLYLAGTGDELGEVQRAALDALGWLPPPALDDTDWSWPYNWWRELSGPGYLANAAGLMLATLVEVHDLRAHEPVRIEVFPSANQDYLWEVDLDHPCGGHLTAV
jgi:hypothetical protein